ncbi:MAG TPA: hypothetical protein V6C97_36430 [Oculatellaceae cyanobacterium]
MRAITPLLALALGITLSAAGLAQYGADSAPFGCPLFHFKDGTTHCCGKAFAIAWFQNRKILVMPLHLLGPGGGYPTYISPQDVPDVVQSVDVLGLGTQRILETAKTGLLRTGVPTEKSRGNLSEDLMAFELPSNCRLHLYPLVPNMVAVGSKVWILTKIERGNSDTPDRFSGTVIRAVSTGLTIKMDSPLVALSSSGSPVVNGQNQLVGMMVGKQDVQRTLITAIPSPMLYAKLYRELKH